MRFKMEIDAPNVTDISARYRQFHLNTVAALARDMIDRLSSGVLDGQYERGEMYGNYIVEEK
jgi:hypothetical protein